VHALWLAARDPRTPWYAKAVALVIAAYALSPIDLIPDFIPVFGYLDEVILLPLAILLAIRLVPPDVMAEHRAAAAVTKGTPVSRAGAVIVIVGWLFAAGTLACGFGRMPLGSMSGHPTGIARNAKSSEKYNVVATAFIAILVGKVRANEATIITEQH
jgi:uncharacterized membrane protein YkvA (DUF1232 family)